MQSLFLVGIAGAAGAVSRYGVGILAERSLGSHFAFGTLLVNVLGCLVGLHARAADLACRLNGYIFPDSF